MAQARTSDEARATCTLSQGLPQDCLPGPGAGSGPLQPAAPGGTQHPRMEVAGREVGERGQGRAGQGAHPTVTHTSAEPREGPQSSGQARSAFRPYRSSGGLCSFIPRPGPLQRPLQAKSSQETENREGGASCLTPCPPRNAIWSSYSSTRGYPPSSWRPTAGPHSQLALRPRKKKKEEGSKAPSDTSEVSLMKTTQQKNEVDSTTGQARTPPKSPSSADSSKLRKRKFPLLPRRRRDPLQLPPPPQLGFKVTVQDLDRERKAAFQRLNRFLMAEAEAEAKASGTSSSPQLSCSGPPPATGSILPSAAPPAPSSGARRKSSQKSAASRGPAAPLGGPAVALPAQSGSGRKHSTPDPLCSSQGGLGSSLGSLPTAQSTLVLPAPSPPSGRDRAGPSHGVHVPCPAPGTALTVQRQTPTPAPSAAAGALPAVLLQPVSGPPGDGGAGGPGFLLASASASAQFSPTSQSTRSSSRVETPTPMCVDPPETPSKTLPPPTVPSTPHIPGLPTSAPGLSSSPSVSSPAGWAPRPVTDTEVTPMDTTPPPTQPLLLGSPPVSSGPSPSTAQTRQTTPRGNTTSGNGRRTLHVRRSHAPSAPGASPQPNFGAHIGQQQGASTIHSTVQFGGLGAPAMAWAQTSPPGQPALGSTPQPTFGTWVPTSLSSGSHGNTQPAFATGPAVLSPGPSSASGFAGAPVMPIAANNMQPNTWPGRVAVGSNGPAPRGW